VPSLQGLTDISDIRKLLREWVSAFEDKPEPEDVKKITRYLVDLVKYSNLEKVQLVIKYLEYITAQNNNEWKMQVTSIKQALDHETIQLYQFPLK
jgi:DNA repair protein REV1